MDSFKLLKRRTTELFQSLEQSLPSLGGHGGGGLKGTWEKIQVPPVPRSSHSADIVDGTLYIFGGEAQPGGGPVDNDMHAVTLPSSGAQADYYAIKAKPAKPSRTAKSLAAAATEESSGAPAPVGDTPPNDPSDTTTTDERHLSEVSLTSPSPALDKGKGPATSTTTPRPELGDVPAPRTGHATAVIGHRIFLFGGSSTTTSSTPLDEGGRVWVFDTRTHLWSFLDPQPAAPGLPGDNVPRPAPRTGHAAVATPKPDNFNDTHPANTTNTTTTTTDAYTADDSLLGQQQQQQQQPRRQSQTQNLQHRADAWRDWALGHPDPALGTPQRPVVGVLAERATDPDADGYGTVVIHGGRVAGGESDTESGWSDEVWSFDVRSRVWQRLPDAPSGEGAGSGAGPGLLALSRSRLYRFRSAGNGDDSGGGQLEYLQLGVDSFDDQVTAQPEETVVSVRRGGKWQSLSLPPAAAAGGGEERSGKEDLGYKDADLATPPLNAGRDGRHHQQQHHQQQQLQHPGSRRAAALEAVTVGGGREYLVLAFGEREAESEAGGGFWDDVWAFQVPSQGMSLASVADTAFSVVGRSSEGRWTKVETAPFDDEDDASADGPGPRGWVASATMGQLEENGIVVWGGVGEGGKRLGDGWIFRLG